MHTAPSTEEWLLAKLRAGSCIATHLIEERPEAELVIRRLLRDQVALIADGQLTLAPDTEADERDDEAVLAAVVNRNAPLPLAELARALPSLTRRCISSAIHRLDEGGFLERVHTHSRAVHWRATDAGKERWAAWSTAN